MTFYKKANYTANLDNNGIPMLNYQGKIGLQYNPIAIAQWGLGNYNLWFEQKSKKSYNKFLASSDWLVKNLKKNEHGIYVWVHNFNFEYRDTLIAPWYSGLAQGQAISLLVRAFKETENIEYKNTCLKALESFKHDIFEGGVSFADNRGNKWIEEYIVNPPTHILNGFIWSLWGLYDYKLLFNDLNINVLFDNYLETLIRNLHEYDLGYWSKYELSNKPIPMIASLFYHKLHIVQLEIMYELTNKEIFNHYSLKWQKQIQNKLFRSIALVHKSIFKVLYY